MPQIPISAYERMIAHCWAESPLEACGLLVGSPGSELIEWCIPTANAARSETSYVVEPHDHLRVDREARAAGFDLVGVFHSHPASPAHPSPTDIAQAPDEGWHYVIVSLQQPIAEVRSFRIRRGKIAEEAVVVLGQ